MCQRFSELVVRPGAVWLRPNGFAHPNNLEEETPPDSVPDTSYATRAKLTMRGDQAAWSVINERLRGLKQRTFLMVSNTDPDAEGYSYCVACGRIEATTQEVPKLFAPHPRPFPTNPSEETCLSSATARKIVLGTDFVTDVALFNMRLTVPIRLRPGDYETEVTLRTASEALAKAACLILEVEPGEILAEFRPGLSSGARGRRSRDFPLRYARWWGRLFQPTRGTRRRAFQESARTAEGVPLRLRQLMLQVPVKLQEQV